MIAMVDGVIIVTILTPDVEIDEPCSGSLKTIDDVVLCEVDVEVTILDDIEVGIPTELVLE